MRQGIMWKTLAKFLCDRVYFWPIFHATGYRVWRDLPHTPVTSLVKYPPGLRPMKKVVLRSYPFTLLRLNRKTKGKHQFSCILIQLHFHFSSFIKFYTSSTPTPSTGRTKSPTSTYSTTKSLTSTPSNSRTWRSS